MTENLIKMPELGEGVTEGELVQWLVSKGDPIKTDQTVAEVMTDKAVMEIPSPVEGVVADFCAQKGDSIPVGQPLLKLMPEGHKETGKNGTAEHTSPVHTQSHKVAGKNGTAEHTSPVHTQSHKVAGKSDTAEHTSPTTSHKETGKNGIAEHTSPVPTTGHKVAGKNGTPTSKTKEILASPFLRRWAKEQNVDLSQISGSGPSGRIQQADVLQYTTETTQAKSPSDSQQAEAPSPGHKVASKNGTAEHTSPVPTTGHKDLPRGFEVPKEEKQERHKLKGIRKKIAEKMQASKAVIPHFTLLESAEVEQLEQLKESVKKSLKEKNIKVTYLPFVMKALLQTVREFPLLNASMDDFSQEMVIKHYYHFGFAVDTPKGLLVPVIKNVDKKSLTEISQEIQTLAEKARQGNMALEDMKGGTITITNIGSLGGEYATPIINAPESTILGMYRVFVKACWNGSAFVPKKTMNFSLTCDHRLIDGAVSARALKFFIHKMENPLSLFIE